MTRINMDYKMRLHHVRAVCRDAGHTFPPAHRTALGIAAYCKMCGRQMYVQRENGWLFVCDAMSHNCQEKGAENAKEGGE